MDVVDKIGPGKTGSRDGMDEVPLEPVDHSERDRKKRMIEAVSRPLLIIFLTILVNLIGFGIIIPLLPFYATDLRRVPAGRRSAVRLLFAGAAVRVPGPWRLVRQVGASADPDFQPRRHSRQLRDAGRGAQPGDAVCRAHRGRPVGRQYHDRARLHRRHRHGREPRQVVRYARRGLRARLHHWSRAGRPVRAHQLYRADLGRRGDHCRGHAPRLVLAARNGAPRNAVSGSPWQALRELSGRPNLRRLLAIDFLYWSSFGVYQTTFALFGAHRFGFDATHTGYLLAAFGFLGVIVQVVLVGPIVKRLGEKHTLMAGLIFAAIGWGGSAMTHSLPVFIAMLVPGALGIGLCNPSLVSLVSGAAGRHEQGRVQGAAGALESLGRTIGPVWGNGALQFLGEGAAYGSAAIVLLATAALTRGTEAAAGVVAGSTDLSHGMHGRRGHAGVVFVLTSPVAPARRRTREASRLEQRSICPCGPRIPWPTRSA